MNKDEYRAAYEGRVGADRMALKLAIIPDVLRGDMDEVARLREALRKIQDIDYRGNRHESHFIAARALMPNAPHEPPPTGDSRKPKTL